MHEKPDLTALIGSRICHDLISPIGAIGNGVELMLMEGAQSSPEMALIAESVAHANAKIRFFRLAFGAAAGENSTARSEVVNVLSDITLGTRLRIDAQLQDRLPRASVKLTFLLVMCLETAMPFGGVIEIVQGEDRWTVRGKADRLKIDPALWAGLSEGSSPDIGPSQVQFALVSEELARQHRRLTTEITSTEVRFCF
jgi:histidine phosphotransferase ChpT